MQVAKKCPKELSKELADVSCMGTLERVMVGGKKSLRGLCNAVAAFEQAENLSFWDFLFPSILSYLQEPLAPQTLGLLYCSCNSSVKLTHQQTRFILANAFFLNIKNNPRDGFGFFDFGLLMLRHTPLGEERLKCLLAYFLREARSDPSEIRPDIIIERCCESPNE